MSERCQRRGFVLRPVGPDRWIKAPDTPRIRSGNGMAFTARLTIDITPKLRGRIKIVAFRRGVPVANMQRALLEREFPSTEGETQ